MLNFWLFFIIFIGYFLGLVLYFLNFEIQNPLFSSWAKKVIGATLLFHLTFLARLVFESRGFVITSLSETLYFFSFLIALASFYMESRYKTKSLMLFSLPMVILICLLAILLVQKKSGIAQSLSPGWLWLHISLIFGGFASLAISFSSAVMYLLQSSQLKAKRIGKIFLTLPSLDALDKIHFRSLIWGVILLSLGILSGLFWATALRELQDILRDPKVILSFLACVTYWVVLSLRLSALRRGQKIAYSTVLIFGVLFIALVTSYYCPVGIHKGF